MIVAADRDHEKLLRREYDARAAAGLDVSWLTEKQLKRATKLEAPGGDAAARRVQPRSLPRLRRPRDGRRPSGKAQIFERSAVTKVRWAGNDVEILLDSGTIRAGTVVIATGSATAEFKALRRHFKRRETYLALTEPLPAAMRRQLGDSSVAIRDTRVPPRRLRWTPDDRLLLSGGDQPETPARTRDAVSVQRTGQLMYDLLTMYPVISGLKPEYGWEASYGETPDGLMYIGPHRNYPRHLFALGATPHSSTGAFVSARILLRALQGRAEKGDEVFGWPR